MIMIEKSLVYTEFLAERDEILRLKWLESHKAGQDIGFEAALLIWVRKHRKAWRSSRRMSGWNATPEIDQAKAEPSLAKT
jgi:hypothetical protein